MTDTIILRYNRQPHLTGNIHLYDGRLDTVVGGELTQGQEFTASYDQLMTRVSRALRENPNYAVVLERRDQEGLFPMPLTEEARVLLRDDPVSYIRSTDFNKAFAGPRTYTKIRVAYDTLADAFGERVYLKCTSAQVHDPVTGKSSQFAYGDKCGWRVRGETNNWTKWLPVEFVRVDDAQKVVDNLGWLVDVEWVTASVEDILLLEAPRYHLPYQWNENGPWISHDELRARLNRFREENKE